MVSGTAVSVAEQHVYGVEMRSRAAEVAGDDPAKVSFSLVFALSGKFRLRSLRHRIESIYRDCATACGTSSPVSCMETMPLRSMRSLHE